MGCRPNCGCWAPAQYSAAEAPAQLYTGLGDSVKCATALATRRAADRAGTLTHQLFWP